MNCMQLTQTHSFFNLYILIESLMIMRSMSTGAPDNISRRSSPCPALARVDTRRHIQSSSPNCSTVGGLPATRKVVLLLLLLLLLLAFLPV
jgi:hypothetical protein